MVEPISMAEFKAKRAALVPYRAFDFTVSILVMQFKLAAMGMVTVARAYEAMADYTRSFTKTPQP